MNEDRKNERWMKRIGRMRRMEGMEDEWMKNGRDREWRNEEWRRMRKEWKIDRWRMNEWMEEIGRMKHR